MARPNPALVLALGLAGCAGDVDGGGNDPPADIEGMYRVTKHTLQEGCTGDPVDTADAPEAAVEPAPELLLFLLERSVLGGWRAVALPCEEQERTCDVESEYRWYLVVQGDFELTVLQI